MKETDDLSFDCGRARKAIHEILDGDVLETDREQWLRDHLQQCGACREFDAELRSLQGALRSLPASRFPEEALGRVWEQTVRQQGRTEPRKSWRIDWRSFAAAAVLTAAAFGLWQWNQPAGLDDPTQTVGLIVIDPERVRTDPEYARQIAEETRRVLGLTSDALRRTERAAFQGILVDEIGGTLAKVPVTWPEQHDEQTERNRQRENEL